MVTPVPVTVYPVFGAPGHASDVAFPADTWAITGLPAAALWRCVARSLTVSVYPELALVSTVRLMTWLWSARAGRLGSIASVNAVVASVNVRLLATTIVLAVFEAAKVTVGPGEMVSIVAGAAGWGGGAGGEGRG